MQIKNIFFDMDGVLTEYKTYCGVNEMMQKGYFGSLKPEWNMLLAFKMLYENAHKYGINVYVLTKVYPNMFKFSIDEKVEWKDLLMPFLTDDHFIMVNGEKTEKSKAVKDKLGVKIDKNCVLIDDYNLNLDEWRKKGGLAIKYVNGVNDKNQSFEGYRLSYMQSPESIVETLLNYIKISDSMEVKNAA